MRLIAQRMIKGYKAQPGGLSKCGEIGVGPILRGRMGRPGQCPELCFKSDRLVQKLDSFILEPAVISLPSFQLTSYLVGAHYGHRTQKPKQPELGEAAKKEARHGRDTLEPLARGGMVDMPIVSERHPNVDVREKR